MNPASSVEIEPGGDPDVALIATGPETAAALAAAAGRKAKATPIRRVFVQPHERAAQSQGGPLAQLVRRRDRRALILYLMIVTMASKEPWDVTRDAQIWARFLDLGSDTKGRAGVSKVIRRLRDFNLITVTRKGRTASLQLLREDGSGDPYTYPDPRTGDRYLKLPHVFWTAGWYQKLELPGLAMLLVLLAEKDEVVLPLDRIPRWYGISRATAQRGFKELLQHDLIATWVTSRTAPLAPAGFTYDTHYRLTGPFDRHSTVPAPLETTSGSIAEFAEAAAALSASQRRRSRRRKPKSSTTPSTERRKSK